MIKIQNVTYKYKGSNSNLLNDLNFSVLCAGTRKMCGWQDDELGVGVPIQKLTPLVEGIIETLNYIEYQREKKRFGNGFKHQTNLVFLSMIIFITAKRGRHMSIRKSMNN